MSEFDQPAYPFLEVNQDGSPHLQNWGLTIRQQAVLMMAQGLMANPDNDMGYIEMAAVACDAADAVLMAERESREPKA